MEHLVEAVEDLERKMVDVLTDAGHQRGHVSGEIVDCQAGVFRGIGRCFARQEPVITNAEGVDICDRRGGFAGEELRGEIAGSADECCAVELAGLFKAEGEAEVDELGALIGGQQDVAEFEVAVEEALAVCFGEAVGGLHDETGGADGVDLFVDRDVIGE